MNLFSAKRIITAFGRGFTLIEVSIYIAVAVILILAVSSFFSWSIKSNVRIRAQKEVLDSASRAMEIMSLEIREAKGIYIPVSIFNATSGQLSLETTRHLPSGEEQTYVDFYLCQNQLCFKKESQEPEVITSENVQIKKLEFKQINTTSTAPSVRIDLKVDSDQSSVEIQSGSAIRVY